METIPIPIFICSYVIVVIRITFSKLENFIARTASQCFGSQSRHFIQCNPPSCLPFILLNMKNFTVIVQIYNNFTLLTLLPQSLHINKDMDSYFKIIQYILYISFAYHQLAFLVWLPKAVFNCFPREALSEMFAVQPGCVLIPQHKLSQAAHLVPPQSTLTPKSGISGRAGQVPAKN